MAAPSRLLANAPVLLVRDVVAAAGRYRDALGFSYDRFYGEPPGFVILVRDAMHLMLKQVEAGVPVATHRELAGGLWSAYFWISDADALHAEFVARGATISYAPCDQFYGCREFAVRDLDGHDIGFGQVLK
ncbi:MAG: VOC family protein [Rhodospirillales bacterium]|nr:VOC family protein [Rhodospirillales bacterium]